MKWQEFINKLLNDFRKSSYWLEKYHGLNSATISKIRNGLTEKPNQETISALENILKIKINDRNPDNITYIKLSEVENKSSGFSGSMHTINIPVLSEVYAGDAMNLDPVHYEETIPVVLMNNHKCFALRVVGKSMETTLRNNEIVVADIEAQIKDGDIVACRLKNGEQYIKRYYEMNYAFVKLTSDNSEYGVRLIDKNDIDKIYKVILTIHAPDER